MESLSKRRGFFPALSELTNFPGKKKKEIPDEEYETRNSEISDDLDISTTSSSTDPDGTGSSCDDVNKVSRKQRNFAKISVRRDKKKEKEKREKIDKNRISMEDFLNKHAEFSAWLEDEKHKSAENMTSPKLKSHFKTFMKLWNKRKLPTKYYRGSVDTQSPHPPPAAGVFNFEDEIFDARKYCKPKSKRLSIETNNRLDSPFSTFGKTPRKLLPITSIQKLDTHQEYDKQDCSEKVDIQSEDGQQILKEYQIPVKQQRLKSVSDDDQENTESIVAPYLVTTYSWSSDTREEGSDISFDHLSSTSNSNNHQDLPIYAQVNKNYHYRYEKKSQLSNNSPDLMPPTPPPKLYTETECLTNTEVDYMSCDEDHPLTTPSSDLSGDEAVSRASLPSISDPPSQDYTSISNYNIPSPPGYAEIRPPESPEDGHWNPPSHSQVYSPRKFSLTKSTFKEKIYVEFPPPVAVKPPVAPKPKQYITDKPSEKLEEDLYIEMNTCPSNDGKFTNIHQTDIMYSDYAVPADVLNSNTQEHMKPADKLNSNIQEHTNSNNKNSCNMQDFNEIIKPRDNTIMDKPNQKDRVEEPFHPYWKRPLSESREHFLDHVPEKVFSVSLGDKNIKVENNLDFHDFQENLEIHERSVFIAEVVLDEKKMCKKNFLETDLDKIEDFTTEEKPTVQRKPRKRTKSAETLIW